MACGNHNAGVALKAPYRKGKHGSRHKLFININLNSVCRENAGGGFGKKVGFNAAVVSYCYFAVIRYRIYICGKPLRRLAHGIYVHTVCARAYNSAKTARSEFKIFIKCVRYGVAVVFDCLKLRNKIGILNGFFTPKLIFILKHISYAPLFFILIL